jgi:peroxiredoxin
MKKPFYCALLLVLAIAAPAQTTHPILPIGAPAPDFALTGVDGNTHKLSDYSQSPILAVIFTCNHCPIAQMYEQRIEKLYETYGKLGVAVIAIQGNDPNATTTEELDSSDMGDTLEEMKARVKYKNLHYPYLFDGETQSVTTAYGAQATPHVFIFDKTRHLRYEGRFDNSYRIEKVVSRDAQNAIDALLAGKPVVVTHTAVFGCSTKWKEKEPLRLAYEQKIDATSITLVSADVADLKKLRANAGDRYTLVSFWATWCGSCVAEFSDLQDTFRMYDDRGFKLVTVSANSPDEKQGVLKFLNRKHATSTNLIFASDDVATLQAAFDPKWQSAVPYTVLLGPNGTVLYKTMGSVDIVELRRKVLAAMPSDYIGFNKYWSAR